MKTWAIIQSGIIINTAIWDGIAPWTPPAGCTAVEITALDPQPTIGWTYDGTTFTPPAS